MKKLIIVRHSKSSWKDFSLSDFNRPLNKRGKTDGPIMSKYLSKQIKKIDIMHCSSSVRTVETSKFFKYEISFGKIFYDDKLYHSSSNLILKLVKDYSEQFSSSLILAHNPGLTYLVNNLTNANLDNLPTTGLAFIEFNCRYWKDICADNSTIIDIKFPKQLK